MSFSTRLTLLPAIALLAACNGVGVDNESNFDARADAYTDLAAGTGTRDLISDLPVSGGADFDGQIYMVLGETVALGDADNRELSDADAIGRMRMTADFTTRTIGGTASNFVDGDDRAYSGSLVFGDTDIVAGTGLVATYGGDNAISTSGLTDPDGNSLRLSTRSGVVSRYAGVFHDDGDLTSGNWSIGLITDIPGVNAAAGSFAAAQ